MDAYAQLLAYLIQGIQFAISLVTAGSEAHQLLTQIDEDLTRMQAEGNRAPTEEERQKMVDLLTTLAQRPPQA